MSVVQQLLDELRAAGENRSYGGKEAAVVGYKAGLSPSTPSSPYMHGPAGLFGVAGLKRDVISTRIQPYGLASQLPARGTVETNPLYPYLTGYAAETGVQPNGVCDDAPESGPTAGCVQTAQFGRITYQTRTVDIARNGLQINRGEFMDLRVLNEPLLEQQGNNGITSPAMDGSPQLQREVLQRFVEVGISFQNKLTKLLYTGNPANNTAGQGYAEFPGLDILIGTGKYDAISGVKCDSLNSDIKDFNFARVDAAGNSIVNVASYLMRYLRYNADHMNLAPVEWAIVMRPELWWELSSVWPCAYMTYRCQALNDTHQTYVIDSNDNIRMRDEMRNGMYLLVDGIKLPVILDTGIVEHSSTDSNRVANTCFASDIYVVPLSIRGGMLATYWEYQDFQETAMLALSDGRDSAQDFWTDGGRYLWHRKPAANWCIQWIAMIKPRVIELVPQLAGRILNVQYCPLQHVRTSGPTDPYFVDGGPTSRPAPSFFSDWNHS